MIYRFCILFLVLVSFFVEAVPSVEEIQSIKLSDMKKIHAWVKDKNTSPRFRVMILERINILLLENRNELGEHGSALLELFSSIIKENMGQSSSYTLVIRKKTCLMLGYFHRTEVESDAYELVKTQVESDSDGDASGACIRSLGEFGDRKEQSVKFINKILENSLKKKKITEDDVEVANASLEIFSKYKMKQSSLVLMKILDSKYPNDVKNTAKKILESIPQ